MDGKEINELRELVEFLKANEIAEFDMERSDLKVRIKFVAEASAPSSLDRPQLAPLLQNQQPAAAQTTAAPAPAAPHPTAATPPPPAADPDAGLSIVKSPIVGT